MWLKLFKRVTSHYNYKTTVLYNNAGLHRRSSAEKWLISLRVLKVWPFSSIFRGDPGLSCAHLQGDGSASGVQSDETLQNVGDVIILFDLLKLTCWFVEQQAGVCWVAQDCTRLMTASIS